MKKLDFDTIKQFTRSGNYEVCIPLDYFVDNIERYIRVYGCELNPDFQRGHVWTEAQQTAFVEYTIKGGLQLPIRFNDYEWSSGSKNGHMVCVDGLQRITALMKFMKNELKVFGGYYMSELENFKAWKYDLRFNVNNLKTRKEVLQWYIELNTGGTIHTNEEIKKVKELYNAEK